MEKDVKDFLDNAFNQRNPELDELKKNIVNYKRSSNWNAFWNNITKLILESTSLLKGDFEYFFGDLEFLYEKTTDYNDFWNLFHREIKQLMLHTLTSIQINSLKQLLFIIIDFSQINEIEFYTSLVEIVANLNSIDILSKIIARLLYKTKEPVIKPRKEDSFFETKELWLFVDFYLKILDELHSELKLEKKGKNPYSIFFIAKNEYDWMKKRDEFGIDEIIDKLKSYLLKEFFSIFTEAKITEIYQSNRYHPIFSYFNDEKIMKYIDKILEIWKVEKGYTDSLKNKLLSKDFMGLFCELIIFDKIKSTGPKYEPEINYDPDNKKKPKNLDFSFRINNSNVFIESYVKEYYELDQTFSHEKAIIISDIFSQSVKHKWTETGQIKAFRDSQKYNLTIEAKDKLILFIGLFDVYHGTDEFANFMENVHLINKNKQERIKTSYEYDKELYQIAILYEAFKTLSAIGIIKMKNEQIVFEILPIEFSDNKLSSSMLENIRALFTKTKLK